MNNVPTKREKFFIFPASIHYVEAADENGFSVRVNKTVIHKNKQDPYTYMTYDHAMSVINSVYNGHAVAVPCDKLYD